MARELPTLYCRVKSGKIHSWRVWADDDLVCTEHGSVDGKKIVSRDRAKPTNGGRANARDGAAQAQFEAEAAFAKKAKEGYVDNMSVAANATIYLPMLAHPYEKKGKKRTVIWSDGVFAQPKLNGLRGLAFIELGSDHVPVTARMVSRQGTLWEGLKLIKAALAATFPLGTIVDGEVFIRGVPLQQLNSLIKRDRDESMALEYHIYDLPSVDGGFEDRYAALCSYPLRGTNGPYAMTSGGPLRLVPTHETNSEADTFALESKYVAEGYEGLIVRQRGRKYEWNDRTDSLLKIKRFIDAEFEVVEVLGREYWAPAALSGTMIVDKFVCKNNTDDQKFETVPTGTMEQRADWWRNKELLVGQQAIVRFQERSVAGLPQGNPVMHGFRLTQDAGPEEQKVWD